MRYSRRMHYTRIYADNEGTSHFEDVSLSLHDSGEIGRLSAPQSASGLIFRETSDTYDYSWHPAPRRQWIILLDGAIEIQVGDGSTRRFGGGEILLVEDTSGSGHRTKQLNAGTRRSLFLPL
ncbi:MAG: hypothetical protein SFV32_10460 [Opitutaceae bacterium]|nr:hypothetical protein [Opitutaceae bacterium]